MHRCIDTYTVYMFLAADLALREHLREVVLGFARQGGGGRASLTGYTDTYVFKLCTN